MAKNIALTLATLAGLVAAAPTPIQQRGVADVYVNHRGDGTVGAGWPGISSWASFDEIWSANLPLMRQSCGWNGWGADNSPQEIQDLQDAIKQVSSAQGVDDRFVLAIVMQESKGCVRVPTTNNGVVNPGLMQSHNGAGSCAGVSPCPRDQIFQMIKDGTAGTASGNGLKQALATAAGHYGGVRGVAYYAAARLYNSGSVDYADMGNGFSSVACYSVDIANRLMGWTLAPTQCAA